MVRGREVGVGWGGGEQCFTVFLQSLLGFMELVSYT